MSKILEDLNPAQREAVQHIDGPLLIFAGAGSGKTRALTYRIAYLIGHHSVDPRKILAVTFTNKAAREMKERIEGLVGSRMLAQMWVGTFHATCARILRENGDKISLEREFVIYDQDDELKLIRECLEDLNLDERDNSAAQILSKISQAKEQLVLPEDYSKGALGTYDKLVDRVYPLYQKKLRANQALDFDDLILYAVRLLMEREDVRDHYQRKFEYILVDEYQDINHAQFEFVRLLADRHKNICVVGDDDQSIYSWRGADVDIILSFQRHYPGAKVVTLEQNYRSTRNILDAAFHVISRNERRAPKQLWTDREEGALLQKIEAVDERDEAVRVVNRIRDEVVAGRREYSDFVILYRTNAQSRVLEEALMNYRVPYKVIGGVRFYERKEIRDLIAYLRLAFNLRDSVSLKRIMNVPPRGIGPVALERIDQFATSEGVTLFEAMQRAEELDIQPKQKKALTALAKLIEFAHDKREEFTVGRLLTEVVENMGYIAELRRQGTREADSRAENVQELFTVVEEFERTSEDKSLRAFLEQVALVTDIDSYDEHKPTVTLMTLHSAKGLEFPVVFMVGMEEDIFPHIRSMSSQEELEEEWRLCYVGMTRAKDELYLSHAHARTLFGNTKRQVVSRFVREIPAEIFQVPKRAVPAAKAPTASTLWTDSGAARQAPVDSFRPSDRVKHNVFGLGIVETVERFGNDAQVTVAFEEVGRKKLMLSFAGLEKVDVW
ncbi:MAG TPA: UvrD-helicase domain-containing protein [Armatimonadota bacterium]|nr:UvrD-helicase domain-containing protein [Armatimonadota bacterium]